MNTAKARARPHHISDGQNCECHRTYNVLLMVNKYDKDEGRINVTVRASGQFDAENQAHVDYPGAAVLRVEEA